jgi:hypothetical protein
MHTFKTKPRPPVHIQAEAWMGTVEQHERLSAAGIIGDKVAQDGSCLVLNVAEGFYCSLGNYIVQHASELAPYLVYPAKDFEATYELAHHG